MMGDDMRNLESVFVKMYVFDEAGEITHETAKAGDAYHIGKFISRWFEKGCKKIELIPQKKA